jgi:hypothetical protein
MAYHRPMPNPIVTDAAHRRAGRERASRLEVFFGKKTGDFVALGKVDPDRYEQFAVRKIVFPQPRGGRLPWRRSRAAVAATADEVSCDARNLVWLCFPGIDTAESSGRRYLFDRVAMIPQQGTAFVFHGPAGIAGYSPDQCLRSTAKVLEAASELVDSHRGERIGVFSFSAGTHLGFYVANQIGRMRGRPVDKFVAVSPGESIAYGIFSTWVTDVLATALEASGMTKETYDAAIAHVTQKQNIEFLPAGRDLVVHAGTADTYIPIDARGGTNDLVNRLIERNKSPTYVVHRGLNHVTLPIKLILLQKLGKNPYLL